MMTAPHLIPQNRQCRATPAAESIRASCSSSGSAFTLTEIIVVIALLGIVASLLLPTVQIARGNARNVQCISNLRTLARAGRSYAADHLGKFPSTTLYNPSNHSKPGVYDYLEGGRTNPAYRCPLLKDYPFSAVYSIPGTDLKGCTYSVSVATSSNTNGGNYTLNYLMRAQQPSQTAWIMDGAWNATYFDTVISPNGLAASLPRLQYPHQGRQNVIFLDGRVESFTREEMPNSPTSVFWTGL